ncbi:MAG: hypothetical protein IPM16_23800 [Chloroflexi bacterium]|nr:hypothetical protein [Chloroflexota bacterium]
MSVQERIDNSATRHFKWLWIAIAVSALCLIITWIPNTSPETVSRLQTSVALAEIPVIIYAFLELRKEIRKAGNVFSARISVLDGRTSRSKFHDEFRDPEKTYPTVTVSRRKSQANFIDHTFHLVLVVYDEVMLKAPMLTVWWEDSLGEITPHQVTESLGQGFQLEFRAIRHEDNRDLSSASYRMFSPTGYVAFKHPVLYGFNYKWRSELPNHTCVMHCELWGSNLHSPIRQDITIVAEAVD